MCSVPPDSVFPQKSIFCTFFHAQDKRNNQKISVLGYFSIPRSGENVALCPVKKTHYHVFCAVCDHYVSCLVPEDSVSAKYTNFIHYVSCLVPRDSVSAQYTNFIFFCFLHSVKKLNFVLSTTRFCFSPKKYFLYIFPCSGQEE